MMHRLLVAVFLVGLCASGAVAQTTSSTTTTTSTSLPQVPFPTFDQGSIGLGPAQTLTLATGQRCNVPPCVTTPFRIMESSYPGPVLYVECDGTCVADVVCRLDAFQYDVSLAASGSLTNSATSKPLAFCPRAVFRVTTCTLCNVRAALINSR